ncbi:hypothetical protein DPX16_3404 [Anabarilius grahami]|uniref:Uncharacterized protein n=1 Tax=Anabarilius grahami TaxID=495550 RepID=A0A3N0XLI5_ANAGA|nr:hypothetical protein DPX16_3404 [Anabarilius grahami]
MEYVLGQRIRRRRERVYRSRQTYISLSEEECIRKLRLTRQAVTDICHLLADELGTDAQCPYAFPVAVKFCDARHGGIGHLRVREWHCAMCAWWNGWMEMEWGKEEEAQQEVVVRLKGHAPWLQQSSPGLRRCAR